MFTDPMVLQSCDSRYLHACHSQNTKGLHKTKSLACTQDWSTVCPSNPQKHNAAKAPDAFGPQL